MTASVYRLYDNTGRLLYVGCSIHPVTRVRKHRRSSPWGASIDGRGSRAGPI